MSSIKPKINIKKTETTEPSIYGMKIKKSSMGEGPGKWSVYIVPDFYYGITEKICYLSEN